jgi:anti-sigma factor RsiW
VSDLSLREMPCEELVELVTDYIEGHLAVVDRARFEAHIADCEYCATYLEQMRQTIRTLGRIPEESLTDDAREALLTAFRSWKAGA